VPDRQSSQSPHRRRVFAALKFPIFSVRRRISQHPCAGVILLFQQNERAAGLGAGGGSQAGEIPHCKHCNRRCTLFRARHHLGKAAVAAWGLTRIFRAKASVPFRRANCSSSGLSFVANGFPPSRPLRFRHVDIGARHSARMICRSWARPWRPLPVPIKATHLQASLFAGRGFGARSPKRKGRPVAGPPRSVRRWREAKKLT